MSARQRRTEREQERARPDPPDVEAAAVVRAKRLRVETKRDVQVRWRSETYVDPRLEDDPEEV